MDGDGRIWHKNECSSGLEIFFEFSVCFVSFAGIMRLGEVDGNSFKGKELSGKQSLMLRRLSRALSSFQLSSDFSEFYSELRSEAVVIE